MRGLNLKWCIEGIEVNINYHQARRIRYIAPEQQAKKIVWKAARRTTWNKKGKERSGAARGKQVRSPLVGKDKDKMKPRLRLQAPSSYVRVGREPHAMVNDMTPSSANEEQGRGSPMERQK